MLFLRDPDAGIGNRKRDHALGAVEKRVSGAKALADALDAEPDRTVLGELQRVREQVFQHLLQALGIGTNHFRRELGIHLNGEFETLPVGYVTEGSRAIILQLSKADIANLDVHFAGFDLGQIENIVNSRISPRTSTVILRERSPMATAVVTWAMLRTWLVRFDAIELTDSVRSFHVPATP
jgi:hypothetical protein